MKIDVPIALIVAICGIAFPIILQTIGQIDTKYGSTRLVDRIKRSWQYKCFVWSLAISVCFILYHPFAFPRVVDMGVLNEFVEKHLLTTIIYISTALLLVSLVLFSQLILKYYSPSKLIKDIVDKIVKDKNLCVGTEVDIRQEYDRQETKTEQMFKDWTDLAVYGLQSPNNDAIRNIYSSLYGYVIPYNKQYSRKIVEYPSYFYNALIIINKVVCRLEPDMSSHHNSNIMATIFIDSYQNTRMSRRSFSALWHILSMQLYVGRLDLVFAYWKTAYQHFSFSLKQYRAGEVTGLDPDKYTITAQDVKDRNEDIENFLQFHNALGGLLLYNEKYKFVSKILNYSNSTFPSGSNSLIITIQEHIIEMLDNVCDDISSMHLNYIYPFKDIDGITASSKIALAIQRYMAVLFIHSEYITRNGGSFGGNNLSFIPQTLSVIKRRKESVEKLRAIITDLFDTDIVAKIDSRYAHQTEIDTKLANYASILDDSYNRRRIEQNFDDSIITENYEYFKTQFDKTIDDLSNVFKCHTNISKDCNASKDIHSFIKKSVDKRQFCSGSDISFVNFKESLSSSINESFLERIVRVLNIATTNTVNCTTASLFTELSKQNLDKNNIIIATSIYFDYHINIQKQLKQINQSFYTYNDVEIYNMPINTSPQVLFVLKRQCIPHIILKSEPRDKVYEDKVAKSDKGGLFMAIIDENKQDSSQNSNQATVWIEYNINIALSSKAEITKIVLS